MNQASPAEITQKLQETLILYWNKKQKINEFEFKRLEREINKIPDYVNKHTTLGMLYAIQNNKNLMVKNFELALSSKFDLHTIETYSISLSSYGYFKELKSLLYEYKDDFNTKHLLKNLFNIAAIYLDIDMIKFVINKIQKLKSDDFDMDKLLLKEERVKQALEITDCKEPQIDKLLNICQNLITKSNVIFKSLSIELIAGGHLVFNLNENDLDLIVDMNFELADTVARTQELDDCKLVAVFQPYNGN